MSEVAEAIEDTGPKMGKKATGITAEAGLRVLVTENPKREGSQAHGRFQGYFGLGDGATVQSALDAGLTMGDLKYDLIHGSIEIDGASVEEYEVTPRGSRSSDDEDVDDLDDDLEEDDAGF